MIYPFLPNIKVDEIEKNKIGGTYRMQGRIKNAYKCCLGKFKAR
jgi:hypothetical protein